MSRIHDLMAAFGLSPRRVSSAKGGEYASPCPGCGGTDRFRSWPEQNDGEGSYWCRRCDCGGDAVQFLMDFEGLSYPEAARRLGREVNPPDNYGTPAPRRGRDWSPAVVEPPHEVWRRKAAELVERAGEVLLGNDEVLGWLADRGIGAEEVRCHRLGWIPGDAKGRDLFRARSAWGLPPSYKEDGKTPKKLWIPKGLLIPAFTSGGEVGRIRIRRTEGEPRYYVLPGSAMAPMLIGAGRRAFVVVESELDALAIERAAGDLVGVIPLGNSTAKPDATAAVELARAEVILVALDFDEPGRNGTRAGFDAWLWWREQFPDAIRWPVPAGKDPGDAAGLGVSLRTWILAGLPPAWRIGRSAVDLGGEGAAPEGNDGAVAPASEVPEDPGGDVPAAVRELGDLLAEYPSSAVDLRGGGIALIDPARFAPSQQWREVCWRLSELVFGDQACWDYLVDHPAGLVRGENFWRRS